MRWLRCICVKAVLLGLLTDLLGSLLFGLAAGLVVAAGVAFLADDGKELVFHSLRLRALLGLGGLFFSALGGYVAARLATRAPVVNALATGALSLLVGLALAPTAAAGTEPTLLALFALAPVPAALLGGVAAGPARSPDQPA